MLRSMKFTHKVVATAAAILVVVFGAFTLSNFLQMRAQTQQDLRQQLQALSQSVSQNIANWLNVRSDIIVATANAVTASDDKAAILAKVKQSRGAGDFKNVYVGLPDGTFILDDQTIDLPADYDARSRPWYQLAVAEDQATFTEPYIDVTTNELTISAVMPIEHNGSFGGVAGGDMMLDVISTIVNQVDFMGLGFAFLVNADGKVLTHTNQQWVDKNISEYLGSNATIETAFNDYEIAGKEHMVSFQRVEGIDGVQWFLAVAIDRDAAFANVASFGITAIAFMVGGVVAVVLLFSWLLRILLRPMYRLNAAVKDLAEGEGDLTFRLPVETEDEFGELSGSMNTFLEKIHHAISEVNQAALQVEANVKDMTDATQRSLTVSDQQSARTNAVATAINQLNASSSEIAENASSASAQASHGTKMSAASRQALQANIHAITELSDKMEASSAAIAKLDDNTRNIEQILEVIKGVTEQTNLLALNAAIEAARAGEAGRGFAVVADEVRGLAQRTQDSAQEIENMIEVLQKGTQDVVDVISQSQQTSESCVKTAHEAEEHMQDVDTAIAEMDSVNHSVASATEEQTTVIKTLDNDIHDISDLNQQGIQNLRDTNAACTALQEQFERLEAMVQRFKV
ncbi:methyl-accepting chemotaxis sensory transducer with Cache sensor [Pseudidiomarina planktonica]|uniref:Methyl-accepting chemotaxis sensory transducer with Cache sensor n=1 Tax=Pseudidiomarina planktonica TaxID=1323738 RepID=A0A1Y6EFU9_9GAMM|nr:methyl-accepting chemotaxis protein [Pseudidiomarina planktonica]RUO66297.1 methyl-accepting chemotaxis protein [Pseudidiomarina planktonica]SMQ59033.1 methyl-accepting chemotaxis sensory transducer with Cache sensor [Pseudidiomarina planktonica]